MKENKLYILINHKGDKLLKEIVVVEKNSIQYKIWKKI